MATTVWKGPQLALPRAGTLPELAEERAAVAPDGILLVNAETGQQLTAFALKQAYRKAARGLAALGFGRGDCLCTLMGNDLSWYVGALAAQSLGGSISGINPLAMAGEIERQFSSVPAKAILAVPPLVPVAKKIAAELDIAIVLSTGPGADGATIWDIDGPALDQPIGCSSTDTAILPFSSGSTGLPKATVVTHANMVASAVQIQHALKFGPGDRLLGLAPLFHIVGPNLFAAVLARGGSIAVVPRFDPVAVFEAIENHHVTHVPLLTPILRTLARHPAGEGRDFAHVRLMGAGGSAMSIPDHAAAVARFGCPVLQVYGMTETSAAIAIDDPANPAPQTVGYPVALMSIRISDEAGNLLPVGREGEIQVSGPNVCSGYLGAANETAAMYTPDGFLRTGDLGKMREDGRLTITGRIKEMIKVNSGQVAPAELEMLLAGHPDVIEAAVVGRPNRFCGEIPVAYLVLASQANPYAVVDWLNEQLIGYKRVRAVEVVKALPKNGTGKLDRKALATLESGVGVLQAVECAA
ncbi:MAG: AMP-binding protein [Rhizobiaceae bacterium]